MKNIKDNSVLYLVTGAGGSGKDTAVNLVNMFAGTTKVNSYTTRLPRYYNEDTHTFVDEQFYYDAKENDNVLAYTYQNNAHYFTTPELVYGHNFYIIDPAGVVSLCKYLADQKIKNGKTKKDLIGVDEIKVIYINTPIYKRFYNMFIHRNDSLIQTIKRIIQDNKIYKDFENESYVDYVVNSVHEFVDLFR